MIPKFGFVSEKRCYYEVLGVQRTIESVELKKSYRKLAMEYHPDRNPDPAAQDRFREIQEAYEVISDPEKRRLYDQFGHEGLKSRGFRPSGFNSMDDIFGGFQSIFEDFFGGGGTRRRQSRGEDLLYRLKVEFREAALGCKKTIEINRHDSCGKCEGSGAEPGSSAQTCPQCGGRGQVAVSQGFFSVAQTCPQCRGSGQFIPNPCRKCHGQGLEVKKQSLEVNVPAGVDTGMRLRLNQEGNAAPKAGVRGDLYVEMEVLADEIFERDGTDLYTRQHIPFPTAVLGGEVSIPLLEGTKNISIPKGMHSPYVKKIPHEGLSDVRGTKRGNLFIEFYIATPEKLSSRAKELLKELEQELQTDSNEAPAKEKSKSKNKKNKKKSGIFGSFL